jgi:4-amino-4-deoxy-L-arabinose transferase-like glycosyltransferase
VNPRHVGLGWWLCGAALALRVGWVLYNWSQHGPRLSYPDEDLHWQLASNLVRHALLATDDGRLAARMPVYPLFLALMAGLGSHGILVARLAQAVVGAVSVGLVFCFAHAAAGRRAAAIAGIFVCCDPFAVFFTNLLLTEVMFTALGVAFTACAWLWLESAAHRRAALFGLVVLGPLVIMTRPAALGWVVLVWLGLVWLSLRRRLPTRALVLCPLALAAFIFPWGLRNKVVLGSWAWLSTNGGATLYDAQGPQADGSSNQAFITNLPGLQGLDEVALDRVLTQRALEQMRADPARVLRLAGTKFVRTWSPTPNVSEYHSGPAAAMGALFTVVLLAGAGWGIVVAFWKRRALGSRRSACAVLVWLPVVFFMLVHCVYVGSVRYRVPLMPFMVLAAVVSSDNHDKDDCDSNR